MPATRATNVQQRQEMARLAQAGKSYQTVAGQTGVSFWTARKWIRRARQGGLAALVTRLGRPATGPMAGVNPLVHYLALRLKLKHPTWGAAYVVKKMSEHPALKDKKLPGATTVWRYWRSFGDRLFPKRPKPEPKLPLAGVVHGVWQMDAKESVSVPGVGAVTFNQARDEFGRATVMHRIHPAEQAEQKIVKLTSTQVQQDCRIAFSQWGLPDAIQTDRASIFVDADPMPFPAQLTLWWLGLGLAHRLIPRHTPRRNGSVERSHRTLDERTLIAQQFNDANDLQNQVDADWSELNAECPSRARGCHGQPPLVAHPELLTPRRPYRPEWELDLFDLKRVDAYLAAQTWIRTVSQNGQVALGGYRYGLGKVWAGQTVSISFDAAQRQFVFTQIRPDTSQGRRLPKLSPVRLDAQGLSVEDLTGLTAALADLPACQLMLPLLMCFPPSTS
jgi:hypothetical protein